MPQMLANLTDSSALNEKVQRTIATLLYQSGFSGLLVVVASSSALVLFVLESGPVGKIFWWWMAMLAVTSLRFVELLLWRYKVADTAFDGNVYLKRYSIGVLTTGLLWMVYPLIVFPVKSEVELFGSVIVLSALAGGTIAILSASRLLAIYYINCVLLFPIVWLVYIDRDYAYTYLLAGLGLLFWIIMIGSVARASVHLQSAAVLHHQNELLLNSVKAEKEQTEHTNIKLQAAYKNLHDTNSILEELVRERTTKLNKLASTDELTGLKNRHTFVEILSRAIDDASNNGENFSILFIDLDGFKEVNDIHGHIVGDEVLKTVTQRLTESVGNVEMLSRWGGDEFVLIVEETAEDTLLHLGGLIVKQLSLPIYAGTIAVEIGCSIGIASFPQHGVTATELLNAADIAMYRVKHNSKGHCLIFEKSFLDAIRNEQQVREGLKSAIENDTLQLFYQAIVPAQNDRPLIYEALLRWEFGGILIPPTNFIPIAENFGLIESLGAWVLERACEDFAQNRLGSDVSVAVNVSVKQIVDGNFYNTVSNVLERTRLAPDRLHIEITESFFASNLEFIANVLVKLRGLGVKISIDDFGTGFSSLSYLQALPVDIVKIDRSFIKKFDEGGKSIITATISIAHTFGCEVIAEGIETAAQRDALISLGAHYLQGYFFSVPSKISTARYIPLPGPTRTEQQAAAMVSVRRSPD